MYRIYQSWFRPPLHRPHPNPLHRPSSNLLQPPPSPFSPPSIAILPPPFSIALSTLRQHRVDDFKRIYVVTPCQLSQTRKFGEYLSKFEKKISFANS